MNTHTLETCHTLTEWLWKSVTTISFLLFTATKWGPASSSRRDTENMNPVVSHPVPLRDKRGSSTLFLDLRKKKKMKQKKKQWDTQRSQRGSRCADVGRVCETWTEPMQRHTQETVQKICNIHRGINYLLKTGPDLLSFCSSAMFAPLFSKRKEKVHVRD